MVLGEFHIAHHGHLSVTVCSSYAVGLDLRERPLSAQLPKPDSYRLPWCLFSPLPHGSHHSLQTHLLPQRPLSQPWPGPLWCLHQLPSILPVQFHSLPAHFLCCVLVVFPEDGLDCVIPLIEAWRSFLPFAFREGSPGAWSGAFP